MDIIIQKSRRKTLTLKLTDENTIKIYAPIRCPEYYIFDFINKKASWIEKRRKLLEKEADLLENLINFNKIMYLGTIYDVIIDKNVHKISFLDGAFYAPCTDNERLKRIFKRFFVKEGQIFLEKLLKQKSKELNLPYNSFKTNVYKTKWGSCNNKNEIKLNSALIMLDEIVINYVITHELCHTRHLNHSKLFWNYVEKFIPDYKTVKNKLKEYNFILKIFS